MASQKAKFIIGIGIFVVISFLVWSGIDSYHEFKSENYNITKFTNKLNPEKDKIVYFSS
jgi:hypothetical protein